MEGPVFEVRGVEDPQQVSIFPRDRWGVLELTRYSGYLLQNTDHTGDEGKAVFIEAGHYRVLGASDSHSGEFIIEGMGIADIVSGVPALGDAYLKRYRVPGDIMMSPIILG